MGVWGKKKSVSGVSAFPALDDSGSECWSFDSSSRSYKIYLFTFYWTLQLQGPNLCWIFVKENKLTSYRKQKGLSRSRGTSLGSFFEDAFRQIWQRCKFCTTWYASLYLFIYLFIKSWVSALPRCFLFGHAHSRTDLLKLDLLLTGSLWAVSTTRRGSNTSLQNVTLDPRIFSTWQRFC